MVLAWFITGPRGGIDRGRDFALPSDSGGVGAFHSDSRRHYPHLSLWIFERGGAWLRGLTDGYWFHAGFCAGVHLDFRRF